jgi:LysM repeat protein
MKLFEIDNKHSLIHHVREEIYESYKMKVHLEKLDEGFFRPWSRYLEEAQLQPGQPEEIFKQVQAQLQKSPAARGTNTTALGGVVAKVLPDSMVKRLSDSLPEPDPKAKADPDFEKKAIQSIQKLKVDQETKQGLVKVVDAGKKNPAAQAIILSLLGGVLGGILTKAAPFVQTIFPGSGTLAMGVIGAVVAGTVAVAAGKIQGKGWKDSFKGAIRPALAGAAGAVIGSLARDFLGNMGGPPTMGDTAHTVQSGDTLSQIAKDNNVSIQDLMKANPDITDPHKISVGQEIKIPPATGNPIYQDGVGAGGPGSKPPPTGDLGKGITVPDSLKPEAPAAGPEAPAAGPEAPAASPDTAGDFVYDPVTGEMVPADSEIGKAIKSGERAALKNSYVPRGKRLSEGQIYVLMREITARNTQLLDEGYLVVEGPMDMLKKAGSFLKTKAQNLTQKVTADKLTAAWKADGSKTDSDQVADFLRSQGVNDQVIKSVYQQMNIPLGVSAAGDDQEPSVSVSDQDADAGKDQTSTAGPQAAEQPKGPKPGQEIEMPGTNMKYKFSPQWTNDKGEAAPEAVVKVLSQLASGVDKADIAMSDLKAARRSVGLMASKRNQGTMIKENISFYRRSR